MKLIRFGEKKKEKPGVLLDGVRKDCSGYFSDWDHDFFLNDGLRKLQDLLEMEGTELPAVPVSERQASCIARPGMILCIGLNFADHAREAGMQLPTEPIVFGKASNSIGGPNDDVILPKAAAKVDYEIELGMALNRDVYELESEKEAEEAIAGYCLTNDLSERSFQLEKGGQWIKGKSCPGFCPTGPFLLTREEAGDINNLWMELMINGEIRQRGSTSTMVFKPPYILYYLSQFMKLEAGDLILTGTPPGVAMGMSPPAYLQDKDLLEAKIQGLGKQKFRFLSGN